MYKITCSTCKYNKEKISHNTNCYLNSKQCFNEDNCRYNGKKKYKNLQYSLWEPKDRVLRNDDISELWEDNVNHPKHYNEYPVEVIDMIELILTPEQFIGYCFGTELAYRLRAGIKDPNKLKEDIEKAEWYRRKRNENSK